MSILSEYHRCRSRACRGGVGRYHTYTCNHCGKRFQLLLRRSIPEKLRTCNACFQDPEIRKGHEQAVIEVQEQETAEGLG